MEKAIGHTTVFHLRADYYDSRVLEKVCMYTVNRLTDIYGQNSAFDSYLSGNQPYEYWNNVVSLLIL